MTNEGYVFPDDMTEEEMERIKRSMTMTGSVYTKHEPIYDLGNGTSMFTFAVKKTQPEVKMEREASETAGGPRVPPAAKKKQTTTLASAASTKTTSSKLRKAPGGGIVDRQKNKRTDKQDFCWGHVSTGCTRTTRPRLCART